MTISPWLQVAGLVMDLFGFALLAFDVLKALANERASKAELLAIQLADFNTRYSFLAPPKERREAKKQAFLDRQEANRTEFERETDLRSFRVALGISLVLFGFLFQIVAASWQAVQV